MSGATELIHRHLVRNKKCSCFKQLHFGVNCYAALTELLFGVLGNPKAITRAGANKGVRGDGSCRGRSQGACIP